MSRSLEDTNKTLAVIQTLNEHEIPCCCVGISALKFYGARRMRTTWEICVPADLVTVAENLFRSDDAFASLKPKKPAPSCIDRRSHVELCDFVDGTNLSEEWGEKNLALNGMHDVRWVRDMQAKEGVCPRWWPTRPKKKREIWQ
ncbi:hypothetical protein MY11210_001119, partial [Beauveria gryllotalpidicola]